MKRAVFVMLATALVPFGAFAVDGVVLINQSTVMAAGGFPYTITQAGSYKLSGNLVVPVGVSGIIISASDVTLDLNGFNVSGPPCFSISCGFLFGIGTPSPHTGITVRNGTISGFAGQLNLSLATSLAADLILRSTGGTVQSPSGGFGLSSIVRHVIADGTLSFNCPAIGIENSATALFRNGVPTSCVMLNNLGPVF